MKARAPPSARVFSYSLDFAMDEWWNSNRTTPPPEPPPGGTLRKLMADIKFACPHCNQHITCDALWGGHELQCPGCQNNLVVPAPPAEPEATSLVPAPPRGGVARVSISRPSAHAAEGAPAAPANKPIPIRNLAPPPKKKQSPVVKIAIGAAIAVVLAAGGYFGYTWWSGRQAKLQANSTEPAKNSDSGQAGQTAAADATDPNAAAPSPGGRPGRRERGAGGAQPGATAADAASGPGGAAAPADNQPVIPPAYTLDVAFAKIPEGKANGTISGTNFVVETARIDPVGTAHVLRLMQGNAVSPDREVLVYLHLKPGEKLGGQNLSISQDMRGVGVPQVTKRWKTNPRFAPTLRSFSTGYAMKLELGELADNAFPGKIYLAFPDNEKSVVAGSFKATLATIDPNQPQGVPVASPNPALNRGASQSLMDQRYGIRR